MRKLLLFLILLFSSLQAGPNILCVVAHPDDETLFAATVYAITHHLQGNVDVVMITNGEGGYKYSTLSEPIYQLPLTKEEVGRKHLPRIRKQEALNGGKIMGVRHYYFFDEQDHRYTQDEKEVFKGIWNIPSIEQKLDRLLACNHYDAVFTMLPKPTTHGHHKAATLLALEAVNRMPIDQRPAILAAMISDRDAPPLEFQGLEGYPLTQMANPKPIASFNKRKPFGFNDRLNYQIIVNWVIAAHKSQGTMQLLMNKGDQEDFYFFAINRPDRLDWVLQLFQILDEDHYEKVSYPNPAASHNGRIRSNSQNS